MQSEDMIRYNLVCAKGHEFESWFANSAAYDKQARRGLLECPACGSTKVEKALMTPRLARTRKSDVAISAPPETVAAPEPAAAGAPEPAAPVAMLSPQESELRAKLKELRDHLVANSENVGQRFPEEARKMHYGEKKHRSIYGTASSDDAQALHEEGIEFRPAAGAPRRAELMDGVLSWQAWAVLSAIFAALTAIFAKVGVENVNSDFATFIRTFVIIGCLAAIPGRDRPVPVARHDLDQDLRVPGALGPRHRGLVALLFPRAQARQCSAGRADRQAVRGAGRGVRGGLSSASGRRCRTGSASR